MPNSKNLRRLIHEQAPLLIPGVYDGITAQLVKKAGFPAAYITGAGLSLSLLGQPDMNTVSYSELLQRVWQISSVLPVPLIVDIDTGFGAALNIERLIRDFSRLDIAAVQIEDQAFPKRCGHMSGKKVVSIEEMHTRIDTIQSVRTEDGPLIIARTDARGPLGTDEAIRRANLYGEWGAELVFIEGMREMDEVKAACRLVKTPMVYNNAEGGASPFLPRQTLAELGFAIAIYPNSLARIMTYNGMQLLKCLKEDGTTVPLQPQMYTHHDLFELFDYEKWQSLADRLNG